MKRIFHISLTVMLALLISSPNRSTAEDVVTETNSGYYSQMTIPKNLKWTSANLLAAKSAQRFLYRKLITEINSLKSQGSVGIRKRYISEQTLAYPDWKKYVGELRTYYLVGFDSAGLTTAQTADPGDAPNLASRLVYLKDDKCLFRDFNLFDFETWWAPKCQIKVESKEEFLRAALRTWMTMSDNAYQSVSLYKEKVSACISRKLKYSISDGIFNCPSVRSYFYGDTSFPLRQQQLSGGYLFNINKAKGRATLTYLKPMFQDWANTASWDPNSFVMRFSND